MPEQERKPFEQWVIVEIMGHQMLAGRATEEVIAGTPLLRVDVPEVAGWPAHTKYVGGGSIFRLHVVTEEHARAAAEKLAEQWGYTPLPVALPDLTEASDVLRRARELQERPALTAGTFRPDYDLP